jgi:hypothetical protein
MNTFLSGQELSNAIRTIMGSPDLRCAVAFWGRGAEAFMAQAGANIANVKIVCDLSMGGCVPDALVELGSPTNTSIRHRPSLHAKVYLSKAGAVVGSANASDNGIGFTAAGAGLLEAGTFHEAGSEAWKAAADWFDRIYDEASPVDEKALARARLLFRPGSGNPPPSRVKHGSLIDMILAQPDRFEGVGFAVVSASSTKPEMDAARKAAVSSGVSADIIGEISDHDMFVGWDTDDVLRWPTSFIELWMPGKRLHLYARTVRAIDPSAGNVFAKKDMRSLRRLLPEDCPSFGDAERIDAEIVQCLLEDGAGLYPSARHLAAAIEALGVA